MSINIPWDNTSGCPLSNHRCVRVRSSHMLPKMHLISQSGSCDTRLNGHHPIAMASSWPGTFRTKAMPHTLGPPALYRIVDVYLDMCGSSGSTFYLKPAFQSNILLLSLKRMYVSDKDPLHIWTGSWKQVKSEEEHNRSITLYGKWLFGSGKMSTAIYPDLSIMPF